MPVKKKQFSFGEFKCSTREMKELANGRKFAVLLKSIGFGKSDSAHFCVGNHNQLFPGCFGVWILGGVCSVGDINLEVRGVASCAGRWAWQGGVVGGADGGHGVAVAAVVVRVREELDLWKDVKH